MRVARVRDREREKAAMPQAGRHACRQVSHARLGRGLVVGGGGVCVVCVCVCVWESHVSGHRKNKIKNKKAIIIIVAKTITRFHLLPLLYPFFFFFFLRALLEATPRMEAFETETWGRRAAFAGGVGTRVWEGGLYKTYMWSGTWA